MQIKKNKMWDLLHFISLKPYKVIQLTNLLKTDISSLYDLIKFINNYCARKVIDIIDDIIYLDQDFIFFVDEDFKESNLDFEVVNSIDSTNDLLIRYIKNNVNVDDKVIIANEQVKGKGRLGRQWISYLGNSLIFSLGVKFLRKNLNESIAVTLVVAYSCVEVLNKYNIPVKIKWPNDIVVDNLKLGGILVNNINNFLIIGVGLNYNNINNINNIINTTCINNYTNNFSIKDVLKEIIISIFSNVKIFQINGFKSFKHNYLSYLRDINCSVSILQNDVITHNGKVLSVSDKGELILQNDTSVYYITNGQLSLRRDFKKT